MYGKSIVISSLILSISLIFCTYKITERMNIPSFPSSLAVTTYDGNNKPAALASSTSASDFISKSEASAYLRMDEAKLNLLIIDGRLDGTFTSYTDGNSKVNYLFSSTKLAQRVKELIEKGNKLD